MKYDYTSLLIAAVMMLAVGQALDGMTTPLRASCMVFSLVCPLRAACLGWF